jgi:hypothetical protein
MEPNAYLAKVGIEIATKGHNCYKLSAPSMMDLTVESWHTDDSIMVSMCHYGEQNGDLMKDPDILFEVKGHKITYKEFQNDYTGYYSESHVVTKAFMENTWIPNLVGSQYKVIKRDMEN